MNKRYEQFTQIGRIAHWEINYLMMAKTIMMMTMMMMTMTRMMMIMIMLMMINDYFEYYSALCIKTKKHIMTRGEEEEEKGD